MQNGSLGAYAGQILFSLVVTCTILSLKRLLPSTNGLSRFLYFVLCLLELYDIGSYTKGGKGIHPAALAATISRRNGIWPSKVFNGSAPTVSSSGKLAFLHATDKVGITVVGIRGIPKSMTDGNTSAQVDTDSNETLLEQHADPPVREAAATTRRRVDMRSGAKRIRKDTFPGPLTVADIIKYRIIAQPPSLNYTRKVLARKPWKRMNIPERIKEEKKRIEETDAFLDQYFHSYLTRKGTEISKSSSLNIDISLFKGKHGVDSKRDDTTVVPSAIYHYNIEELLQIWNTKGGYFYTNIPKTVAMLQIVRKMAQDSKADDVVLKTIREHLCFKRVVGSVLRHMKYVTRIVLPSHLKNYDRLSNMVPMFSAKQLTTIFSVLAYFGYRNEKVIDAMMEHAKPFKKLKPEEMREIIMACLSMKVDPTTMVEEYVERLQIELKNGKERQEDGKATEEHGTAREEHDTARQPHAKDKMAYYLDILTICSKTDQMNNWIFSHIAEFVKGKQDISMDDAVEAVCLFIDVQHLDEALFVHLYKVILENIKAVKSKNMVKKLITSLSMCHFQPPKELIDHLSSLVLKELRQYNLVELTAALRGLALMNNYNDLIYSKVLELEIFQKPPSVKVLQHLNLQLNQKRTIYSAYLHPASSSSLNVIFGNLYQSYLGYRILSKNKNLVKVPTDVEDKLKDIYTSGVRNWTFSSSSFHLQVRDLLKDEFGIESLVEHITEEGLVLDLAILPCSLEKHMERIKAKDFLKDKKCAIEVHGPFHYLQKSTEKFPPPLDNTTLFKERLLRETGWDVSHIHYWSFVPWMKKEHKIRVLQGILPKWVQNICLGASQSQGALEAGTD